MNEKSKNEIETAILLLRDVLIMNGASVAVSDKGKLSIFDTKTYLETGKMNGLSVDLERLVK